MSLNKTVSVIMSVYNAETTVAKSIESLIGQTYENLEILLVDDSSTDETFNICKEYENNFKNIHLFKNKNNLGLTKNLNFLINKSKGDFLARQDSDDISEPSRIEKQLNFIKKYNLDGCTTRAKIIQTGSIIPKKSLYLPKRFVINFKNPFIHGSLVLKKTIAESIGNYNEKFYYSQDYKLMYDLITGGYKLKIMKECLYHLNMNENISTNKKTQQQYYARCVKKNIEPELII
jgi:glycosyltransferase EpsE